MKSPLVNAMVVLAMSTSARGSDLMDAFNLSFEADTLGHVGTPTQWTFPESPTIVPRIVPDAPRGEGGEKSLEVDCSKARVSDGQRMFLSGLIPIDSTRKYILSFWLKAEGPSPDGFGVSIGAMFYDQNKRLIEYDGYVMKRLCLTNAAPTPWTLFQRELTPASDANDIQSGQFPPTAKYTKLQFLSYNYTRKYWIDAFRFEPARETFKGELSGGKVVARATKLDAPVIADGKLDEAVWKDRADWNTGFRRTLCAGAPEMAEADAQTEFKVAFDNDRAYFGFICRSAAPDSLRTSTRKPNDMQLFDDEDIEIFIDAGTERKHVLQLGVNPSGSLTALPHREMGIKVATARRPDGWQVELAVPFKSLWQYYQEAGGELNRRFWFVNVCRHQPGSNSGSRYSCWSDTGGGFSNNAALGALLFVPPREVLLARLEQGRGNFRKLMNANRALMAETSLPTVKLAQNRVRSIVETEDALWTTLDKAPGVAPYLLPRLLEEIDGMTPCLERGLDTLKRLTFAFPETRAKYGYLFYSVPLVERPDKNRVPERGESLDQLSGRLAGDETTALSFAVFTRTKLENISLSWTSLKDGAGHVIPLTDIDLRVVFPWGKVGQADILATDLRQELKGWMENYADLPRFAPLLQANNSLRFIMKIAAKSGQAAGIYRGTLVFAPDNALISSIPIAVEVLPFDLCRTERYVGFYTHGVLNQPKGPKLGAPGAVFYNGLESEKSMGEELKSLRQDGFTFVTLCDYAAGTLDPKYGAALFSLAGKAGFKQVAILGSEHWITNALPANEAEARQLSQNRVELTARLRLAAAAAKANGIERLYVYGFDEPHDQNGIARNRVIFEAAKQAGIDTITACVFDNIRERLVGLDVVIMNYSTLSSGSGKLLEPVMRGKTTPYKKVLYYANLSAAFTPMARLTFGWHLYKSNFDGNIPWAYYFLHADWEPFLDYGKDQGGDTNSYYVFPTKDKPVPTLKYEAAREGVNDLRYLETLERRLNDCPDRRKADIGRERLRALLDTIETTNPQGIYSKNYLIAPATYDQLREKLRDMIMDLR